MAKKFDIPKQSFPSVADAYNSLIGIDNTERVVNLPLSQLDEIDEQPFPVNEEKVDQIADSIENVGVIEPVIVVKNGDRYIILSGRHRFRACQKLGKAEIPCHIKETDDTTARYILIATNTDRNNEYSPIVYARAYTEQIELMKKLGKKSVVNAISEQNGINRKQIYRYLRLNYLIPELQKWVEDKILTIEAAVELSFLSDEKQLAIVEHINNVVTINESCFYGCEMLKDVKFADNSKLSTICKDAFFDTGITRFTVPENCRSVSTAFDCCYDLKDIYILGKETSFAPVSVPIDTTIHYYKGSKASTQLSLIHGGYKNIEYLS